MYVCMRARGVFLCGYEREMYKNKEFPTFDPPETAAEEIL